MKLVRLSIVRTLVALPLLSSIYTVMQVYESSLNVFCKIIQITWFTLAVLYTETIFEFPHAMLTVRRNLPQRSRRLAEFMFYLESIQNETRGPGVYMILQICHVVAFVLAEGSHALIYSILLTYCPFKSTFTHSPLIFTATIIACTFSGNKSLCRIVTRAFEVFSACALAYVCLLTWNWVGIFAGILLLLGFLYAKSPHGTSQLDDIYWFLWGVDLSVIMMAVSVNRMITSGVSIKQFYFFSNELGKECILKTTESGNYQTGIFGLGICQIER